MIRRLAAILLALPVAAAMFGAPAQAQYYAPQSYGRDAQRDGVAVERLPPPGYYADDDENAPVVPPSRRDPRLSQVPPQSRGVPGYPDRADALPPPGFASPYGHQLDATGRPLDAAPAGQPPGARNDPDFIIRPPQPIGSAPQAGQQPPPPAGTAALPPEDQPEMGQPKELPANLKKQLVDIATKEPAGTIIIDTPNTYLYLALGGGKALRYGIGVGREGFTWAGTERISKMKEWPDWFPPPEMIDRQPYLPRVMAGGPGNPLGARALYLGNTLYRIHGTNQPSTIGQYVSSGCIRLLNEDIEDLFSRVQVGTRVVVMPGKAPETVANTGNPGAGGPTNLAPESAAAVSGSPLPPMR
jgi:lipoprotein-anchoring transpeptidase ErfK/SrfK